jgi:transposase
MAGHGSWRLGPGARRRIVEEVKAGMSQKRAAARFCVSPATVNRWVRREREASTDERVCGAWAQERSSRPLSSPRMISDQEQDRICEVRERTGWGPRLIAPLVGRGHSTVHAALRRRGCSRKPKALRESVVRYEWPCPGQLLHVDVKKFGRFSAPGHAVTGDRTKRSRRVGWDYAHSLVDDCSRLAYTELLADERGESVTAFMRRGLNWFSITASSASGCSQTTPGPTPTTARSSSCSAAARSSTKRSAPTVPRPTARWSATSRPSLVSGPTGRATPPQTLAAKPCHTGCSTTTRLATTAPSATARPSPGFTTSSGRTARAAPRKTETLTNSICECLGAYPVRCPCATRTLSP